MYQNKNVGTNKRPSVFQKSVSERSIMQNLAIAHGIDPDNVWVDMAATEAELLFYDKTRRLESHIASALKTKGNAKGLLQEIGDMYGISRTSPIYDRVNPSEGALGLKKAKVLELLETLRPEFEKILADAWFDNLTEQVKKQKLIW